MATYFFNIFNDETTYDPEGMPLVDDAAALARAAVEARELAADSVRQGHLNGSHHIEVVDERGKIVGTVRYDEAVVIS